MKLLSLVSIITIIGIVAVGLLGISYYQQVYTENCANEGGSMTGILQCTKVWNDFTTEEELFRSQLEKLANGSLKPESIEISGSLLRKIVDSDEFSHDEKLKAIELEHKIGQKNIENVITGSSEFENDQPITFQWTQFGYGYPCPAVSIQVQNKGSDKPFYEHEKTILCPVTNYDSAFLFTFTEKDFPDFPTCTEFGEYTILAKNQFGELKSLHEYLCKGTSLRPGMILAVDDSDYKSGMNLEMISEKEYKTREDSRKPWTPNPILDITEKELHPKVKAMLEQMWNFGGYTTSKYNKNVLEKTVNLNSTEMDHKSIYDWLKENHKKQFGNADAGFTNYFRYEGKIYSLSWEIID